MMKKLSVVPLISLMLYGGTLDTKEYPHLGLSVTSYTIDLQGGDKYEKAFGLSWGKQTQTLRTTIGFTLNDNFDTLYIEIDKIFAGGIFGNGKYRPYVGGTFGSIGYMQEQSSDDSGTFYGLNVGMLFYINSKIDVDLKYYYYRVREFEGLTHMKGPSLSVSYFY